VGHKEGGLHHSATQPFQPAAVEHLFHVRRFAPTIACHHAPESGRKLLNLHAANVMHIRCVFGAQCQQDHPLMQHLVVLQVMHHRKGNDIQRAGHIDRRARHAYRRRLLQRGDHRFQRVAVLMHAAQQAETFALPGGHHQKHHQTQAQWQPATGDNLIEVRREERHINTEE